MFKKTFSFFSIIIALLLLTSCAPRTAPVRQAADERTAFSRDIAAVDYSGLKFTPWDVDEAAAGRAEASPKAYTVMIYMNGSDLESESGAATADLTEILSSGVDTDNVNIVILAGGTNRWQNNVIPSNECTLWLVDGGEKNLTKSGQVNKDNIKKLAGIGLVNMGDPGTLTSFIDFTLRCFPAEKYGLIFWDHGGGSIAGYGYDEVFGDGNMTLLEMDYALGMSGLDDTRLEFLGFDACLMASVEMAVVASQYADYLIASEDLEPGDGWNYDFLPVLNDPGADGEAVGEAVADSYMRWYRYGLATGDSLTMSVVDLTNAGYVMGAMGNLMARCSDSLIGDRASSFTVLAKRRGGTKTFGAGSARDNDCDMVDIGDMAQKLADVFPEEAAAVQDALEQAVVINRHNSDVKLGGLTTYYIYATSNDAENTLPVYDSLGMSREYTGYLYNFTDAMTGKKTAPSKKRGKNTEDGAEDIIAEYLTVWEPVPGEDGRYRMTGARGVHNADDLEIGGMWPSILGVSVCLDVIERSDGETRYAVPVTINGEDADIIIKLNAEYPKGRILGSRKEEGYVIQKGLDEIREGDRIRFYHRERSFKGGGETSTDSWRISEEVTVKGNLKLGWRTPGKSAYYSVRTIDLRLNEQFSELSRFAAG